MKKKKIRKVNNKKTDEKKISKKARHEDSSFVKVISTVVAIAIAIFIAFANFSLCGRVGEVVRSIVLSTFGLMGYLFPIVIVIAIIITLSSDRKTANVKIYSLLILYTMLICFVETLAGNFRYDDTLSTAISNSIMRAKNGISIDASRFSGGIIGTFISYIFDKAIGETGSMVLFITVSVISFIILFGLGISKVILKILRSIVMFIPNLITKMMDKREEDRQIAIENENILKATIEKSKSINYEVNLDDKDDDKGRLSLDPLPEKKVFDTSKINITPNDIQSRFYTLDEKEVEEKNELLREMHKKSINEILYKKKEIKPNSFFYDENMKPIDQLENITLPESKVDKNQNNINSGFYQGNNDVEEENDIAYKNDIINNDANNNIYDNDKETTHHEEIILGEADNEKTVVEKNEKEVIGNEELNTLLSRKRKMRKYRFPSVNLLYKSEKKAIAKDPGLNEKSEILVETLRQFGVGVTVTNITVGPSVTRFELKPDLGVKVSKILALENDIKLALSASDIRIEAPIPGKPAIGIEIPNKESSGVLLGDIISSNEFRNAESKRTVAIGKDISGRIITTDLRKMPHLLIAGATGSGKSVCINSIITSLIYKSSPEDVRLLMVDPKVVELQVYDGIPHLLVPVVTNPKKAAAALNWAVNEMTRRYNLIQEKRVRDIESYNRAIEGEINKIKVNDENEAELEKEKKLPYIVIIIDEFADLMMVSAKEVENSIMRIAQLARACGIYLVIATQRPSVNVISGSIKTNVPSRISFAVASGVDSQTILDRRGAEKLLGHGDMLYFPQGIPEPVRVQGCYVTENEILEIVNFVKDTDAMYDEEAEVIINKSMSSDSNTGYDPNEKDELFYEAGKLIIEQQSASIGLLQRRFRVGFNRAARMMDQLEANGVISKQDGKKPREVLMTMEEFEERMV